MSRSRDAALFELGYDVVCFTMETLERAPGIFVRTKVDDRWETRSLSSLPKAQQAEHIARWYAEGRTPVST